MAARELIVRGPTYFSGGDETVFFSWLLNIGCVSEVEGHARSLHICLKRQPSDADLRELIALFWRYRMSMKPLAALKTPRNAAWFANDPTVYWHAKVFGKAR